MAVTHQCIKCGWTGYPKTVVRGSFLIEIVLWIFFIIPGIIYSIWRLTTKYKACSLCNSSEVIPSFSPTAIQNSLIVDDIKCYYCAEIIKKEARICKHCGKDVFKPDAKGNTNLSE